MNTEHQRYQIDEATAYFINNGVDPREIDKETLLATERELRENPCIIEPDRVSSATPEEVIIPQEGRARELLDNLFGRRGITPEEAPPEILRIATRMIASRKQTESVMMDISTERPSIEQSMNSGIDYNL